MAGGQISPFHVDFECECVIALPLEYDDIDDGYRFEKHCCWSVCEHNTHHCSKHELTTAYVSYIYCKLHNLSVCIILGAYMRVGYYL